MPTKLRKQRTNEELQTVTNRLFYEWTMLVTGAAALELITLSVPNKFLESAFIESCAIHARNFVAFFYPFENKNGPKPSDAIVDDFFQDLETWKNVCPIQADILKYDELGGHANVQIAHIVYSDEGKEPYVSHGHYEWQFTLIADKVQPIFEEFIRIIPKEQLGNRWSDKLHEQKGIRWELLKMIVNEKLGNI